MRILVFFFVLVTYFFSGCSTDPISPTATKSGSILFKIDKENAPENVSSVTAYLSRTGFTTLSASMNILTDSTADLGINNIPVGGWHLKVDAMDQQGNVVYSGRTDVIIEESVTIQVSLTLLPTSTGTGSIQIFVTWGTHVSRWIDFSGNPVIKTSFIPRNPAKISECKVLFDEGKYKIWFNAVYSGSLSHIYYAESRDGIEWIIQTNKPALSPGLTGWDIKGVAVGAVIKDDTSYVMFYSGVDFSYNQNILLAYSSDGINWVKKEEPIFRAPSSYYKYAVHSALKVDGRYFVYYGSILSDQATVNLAKSSNLVNWEFNNQILKPTQRWEMSLPSYAGVIYDDDGLFKMIYQNANATAFGEATSADGINWRKNPNNPVIRMDQVYNRWCSNIAYPYYFKKDNIYRIYYTGSTSTGEHIGFFQRR
jgi:predicted GH43/DUF377 family glycosyl hydrolase